MYYGCKKEITDKRDYKFTIPVKYKKEAFPEEYQIKMPKVKDQGIVNSCVAHALSTFLEESYKKDNKNFSTGFIYGYRPVGYSQEEGMYPRQALKTLQKLGDVEEKDFSHNKEMPEIKELVNKNLEELKKLASLNKINSYARIFTEKEIKECIYNDCPVPISIPVRNGLELEENYILLNKDKPIDGYHMIIIYGWTKSGWLIQNSWGKYWGDNGRAILPYDYEIDSAWAISTTDNFIETYQTIWQRIYKLIVEIINKLRSL